MCRQALPWDIIGGLKDGVTSKLCRSIGSDEAQRTRVTPPTWREARLRVAEQVCAVAQRNSHHKRSWKRI